MLAIPLVSILFLLGVQAIDTASELNHHIDIFKNGNILEYDSLLALPRFSLTPTLRTSEFSVSCKDCSVVGDFSLSGGCNELLCIHDLQPDANFSGLPFDFNEYWIGAVIEDFAVHLDLELKITPSNLTNEIWIPLIQPNGFSMPLEIDGVGGISWNFNPVLHGWVNSSKPIDFSYGFDFNVSNNPSSSLWH